MKIKCHCSSCGADFEVGEQFAGRKAKCPMCSQPILIAAAAPKKPPIKKRPPAASVQEAAAPAQESAAADESPDELPQVVIGRPRTSHASSDDSTSSASSTRGRNPNQGLRIGAMIAGCVAVVGLAVGLLFVLNSDKGSSSKASNNTESARADAPSRSRPQSFLEIDLAGLPDIERLNISVLVDGKEVALPESGPLMHPLRVGKHVVKLMRRGYEQLEFTHTFEKDEPYTYTPKWKAVAKAVVPSQEFEEWAERFRKAEGDSSLIEQTVKDFDEWRKANELEDAGLGAHLHLTAAMLLLRTGDRDGVIEQCEAGLEFQAALDPDERDETIQMYLEGLLEFTKHGTGPGGYLAGTGTGFCIAPGGYVLTNHHVIEGAKSVMVRLHERDELVPAKVVARDAESDMALLKVEVPEGYDLKPILLAKAEIQLGEPVRALGFPYMGFEGNSLTVTEGVVSTLASDESEMIRISNKVNPGNSGGPLFDNYGRVLGMVTAKTLRSGFVESFGLAVPSAKLREFVNKSPTPVKLREAEAPAKEMKISDLAPSVVLVQNMR